MAPRSDPKVTDTNNAGSITSTGTILNLQANLVTGTGYKDNYIGRKVTPIGLSVRFDLAGAQSNVFAGADLNNFSRLLVFQWMDNTTPTVATVLETIVGGAIVLSPILMANYNNIQVLVDKTFPTWVTYYDSSSGYSASNGYNEVRYVKGKKMVPLEFTTSTVVPVKGSIWALLVSDSAIAPSPAYTLYTRLTFLDV